MKGHAFLAVLLALLLAGGCNNPGKSSPASSTAGVAAADTSAVLPVPGLGYNAREGRALYRHYCIDCHGETGGGDGFNAYNLDPRPPALADSAFQATHADEELATAIREGGSAVGLSTNMPPYGRTLNRRMIANLVEFLRSLWKPSKPAA